jgi:cephalosporin hydroxylase
MLRPLLRPMVRRSRSHLDQQFFTRLINKTDNFRQRWLGQPIRQNILDLWTIQETLCELRPALLIECGTNRGGSSHFFGTIFDLIGNGRVITVDIRNHRHDILHPRVTYLVGSSVAPGIVAQVANAVAQSSGPVMVLLDSDHSESHVRREMDAYHCFVTPGSFLLVQDGVIDTLRFFAVARPGPLPAIEAFLRIHPEFEVDNERCQRFLITHSPKGWLRRLR